MNNRDIVKSIMGAVQKGTPFQLWAVGACAEFGVFQPVLEKKILEMVESLKQIPEAAPVLQLIFSLKGLPGTVRATPKSPVLAGRLCGKLTDYAGREVIASKKAKTSNKNRLVFKNNGILPKSGDRSYIKSLRK